MIRVGTIPATPRKIPNAFEGIMQAVSDYEAKQKEIVAQCEATKREMDRRSAELAEAIWDACRKATEGEVKVRKLRRFGEQEEIERERKELQAFMDSFYVPKKRRSIE